jgi:hypothetical protein
VQLLVGLDLLDRLKLKSDVSGCVGVQDQRFDLTTVPVSRSPFFRVI